MDDRTQFDYLLNALENAAAEKYPAKAGYAGKRQALFAYVRDLERRAALADRAGAVVPQESEVHAAVRKVGGIVHSDGNLFFTNAAKFLAAMDTLAAAPAGTQEQADAGGVPGTRKCLYCERDMLVGSECTSASQSTDCEMRAGVSASVPDLRMLAEEAVAAFAEGDPLGDRLPNAMAALRDALAHGVKEDGKC